MSFSTLPPELEESIFKHLPMKDLLTCQRVCRQWRAVIETSPTLRNHVDYFTTPLPTTAGEIWDPETGLTHSRTDLAYVFHPALKAHLTSGHPCPRSGNWHLHPERLVWVMAESGVKGQLVMQPPCFGVELQYAERASRAAGAMVPRCAGASKEKETLWCSNLRGVRLGDLAEGYMTSRWKRLGTLGLEGDELCVKIEWRDGQGKTVWL